MKGGRRRYLSTFEIAKFGPGPSWPQPINLPPLQRNFRSTSAVRTRKSLDLGLSPRLTRQTSELQLITNQDRGWGVACGNGKSQVDNFKLQSLSKDNDNFVSNNTSESDEDDFFEDDLSPLNFGTYRRLSGGAKHHNLKPTSNTWPRSKSLSVHRSMPTVHEEAWRLPQLRRPTVLRPTPVQEDDNIFRVLLKGKELKPFDFRGDKALSDRFYSTHYPILLSKFKDVHLPKSTAKVVTEKEAEEELRYTQLQRRAMELHQRMERADAQLNEIEADVDEYGSITTELKADIFNPAKWPWNLQKYSLK